MLSKFILIFSFAILSSKVFSKEIKCSIDYENTRKIFKKKLNDNYDTILRTKNLGDFDGIEITVSVGHQNSKIRHIIFHDKKNDTNIVYVDSDLEDLGQRVSEKHVQIGYPRKDKKDGRVVFFLSCIVDSNY